jgi:hypothetical protein
MTNASLEDLLEMLENNKNVKQSVEPEQISTTKEQSSITKRLEGMTQQINTAVSLIRQLHDKVHWLGTRKSDPAVKTLENIAHELAEVQIEKKIDPSDEATEAEEDKPANVPVEYEQVENTVSEPVDDGQAENPAPEEAEDEPAEDETAEDEPAEDEPAEDEPAEDEPAEDPITEPPVCPSQTEEDDKKKHIPPALAVVMDDVLGEITITPSRTSSVPRARSRRSVCMMPTDDLTDVFAAMSPSTDATSSPTDATNSPFSQAWPVLEAPARSPDSSPAEFDAIATAPDPPMGREESYIIRIREEAELTTEVD